MGWFDWWDDFTEWVEDVVEEVVDFFEPVAEFIGDVIDTLFGVEDTPGTPGGGFSSEARERSQVIRSSVQPRRVVYGEVLLSGPLVFASSSGSTNEYLHLVVALAGHECQGLGSVYLKEYEITPSMVDGSGDVTTGKYSGFVRIKKHLGTTTQTADSDLVSEVAEWTTNHRLRGVCYIYLRLKFDRDVFPTGIPNIRVVVKGAKILDTRTSATAYSTNPAMVMRDYLARTDGLNAATTEIDTTTFDAAANICDEEVSLNEVSDTFTASSGTLTRADTTVPMTDGDLCQVSTTGGLPSPLVAATNYYYIRAGSDTFDLASSRANALVGTAITVTTAGTGTQTITRKSHIRYDANGSIDLDVKPVEVNEKINTASAAALVYSQGLYKYYVADATAASAALDESWLRGPIKVRPKPSKSSLFNKVKGTFVNPDLSWQPSEFTPVTNSAYVTSDGDEEIVRSITFPFTTNNIRAQRIAKIHLETARQGITVEMPCSLRALPIGVWDVVTLSIDTLGWSAKEFRVISWRLTEKHGVDLVLREESSSAYDWEYGDATEVDPAPDTSLVDSLSVVAPGAPSISESLYTTTNSAGVKARATITWTASTDPFLAHYQLEAKFSSASTWAQHPPTTNTTINVDDIAPGTYDFRVKAVNTLDVSSAWAQTLSTAIVGLTAAPSDVSNLTVSALSGVAIVQWTTSTDLDVLINGKVVLRHNPNTSGASWQGSTALGELDGASNQALLPLLAGTYLAKFEDSSGNESNAAAQVTTEAATVITFSSLGTITENPTFSGDHTNTHVAASKLQLSGTGNVDDASDFDAIINMDLLGGIATTGTYDYASGFDFGSVKTARLTSTMDAAVSNVLDRFDSRTGNVDDWSDFDGTAAASATATAYYRLTNDDPSSSPTWGSWQVLTVADVSARGVDLQARLESLDSNYNILITTLSATAEEPA